MQLTCVPHFIDRNSRICHLDRWRTYHRSKLRLSLALLELLLYIYLCKSGIRSYLPAATYPPGFGLCELGRLWLTVKKGIATTYM